MTEIRHKEIMEQIKETMKSIRESMEFIQNSLPEPCNNK